MKNVRSINAARRFCVILLPFKATILVQIQSCYISLESSDPGGSRGTNGFFLGQGTAEQSSDLCDRPGTSSISQELFQDSAASGGAL